MVCSDFVKQYFGVFLLLFDFIENNACLNVRRRFSDRHV